MRRDLFENQLKDRSDHELFCYLSALLYIIIYNIYYIYISIYSSSFSFPELQILTLCHVLRCVITMLKVSFQL